MRQGAVICLFVFASLGQGAVAPSRSELEAMFDRAAAELDANHFEAALRQLDVIDARQPNLAPTQNLRGLVWTREGKYEQAEAAFRKALEIDPTLWDASFNLAQVPFLQRSWTEARQRFEALRAGRDDQLPAATSQLVRYKILLTFALEGDEQKADTILDRFKDSADTPALYYSKAALAFQHGKKDEAKKWMALAEKKFSPQLNKLFAESFYELSWMEKPAGGTPAALEITSRAERAARLQAETQTDLQNAERAFQERNLDGALQWLDRAGSGAAESAGSSNLRGKILLKQKKIDEAEAALHKALAADPNLEEARINLAQIPFEKKDYGTARAELEALVRQRTAGAKDRTAPLIQYRMYMTLLLEGQEGAAQKMMEQFKFTDQTPALYYAQAAWAFAHQNPKQGNDWIVLANKVFSPSLNRAFADSFDDMASLGGLTRTPATVATPIASAPLPTPTVATEVAAAAATPTPVASAAPEKTAAAASKKSRERKTKSTRAKRTAHSKKSLTKAVAAAPPVAPSPTPAPTPEPPRPSFVKRLMRTLLSPVNRRRNNSSEIVIPSTTATPSPTPVNQKRQ
jgi:tetratricopeptide (TPR) repeat protein